MKLEKETSIYQLGAIASDIEGAVTLAKGKNKIFYQNTAPASGMNEGDLWFNTNTNGGSSLYEYMKTGSNPDTFAWTLRQLGQGSLVAGSVTANEIYVASLSAISALLGNVTVGGTDNDDGVITILDANGNTIGSWDNTGIDAQKGTIGALQIDNNGNLVGDHFGLQSDRLWFTGGSTGDPSYWLNAVYGGTEFYLRHYPANSQALYDKQLLAWLSVNAGELPIFRMIGQKLTDAGTDDVANVYDGSIYMYPPLGDYSTSQSQYPVGGVMIAGTGQQRVDFRASNSAGGVQLTCNHNGTCGLASLANAPAPNDFEFWLYRLASGGLIHVGSGGLVTDGTSSLSVNKESATDGKIGVLLNSSGNIYLTANTNLGAYIYFYYNKSTSSTANITESASGVITVNGTLRGKDYSGTVRTTVNTSETNGYRVAYLYHASGTTMRVYGQKGSTSGAYSGYTTFTGTSSSDIRLKENIAECEVDDALDLINRIEMKSFDWKPGEREYTHQPIGMIADQVEQLDSRLSIGGGYDEDGTPDYKVIDDHYLACYLTKAVQELSQQVEQLKAEIAELKRR